MTITVHCGGEAGRYCQDMAVLYATVSWRSSLAQVKIRSTILEDKEEASIRPHAFLMRMLANLKGAYVRQNDPEKCLRVQQYLRCASLAGVEVGC